MLVLFEALICLAASPRYMASVVCVVHGFVDDVSQSAWQRTG